MRGPHDAECELCCDSSRPRQGPDLIYVIGSGRSGSTVLERVLGSAPGVVAVGELHALWRLPLDGLTCSCGNPVRDCDFWRQTLGTAGLDRAALTRLAYLEHHVVRNRHLVHLGYRPDRIRADPLIAEFLSHQARLFDAIRQTSGATTVIDSSKAGPRGWILAAGFAPLLLHARRGAEEVMTSWRRGKPDPGSGAMMPRQPITRAGWDWIKAEQAARSIARRNPVCRIDHADFCRRPRATLAAALDSAAPRLVDRIAWTGPDQVTPAATYHSVLGNPDRFDRAEIVIRPPVPPHPAKPGSEALMIRTLGRLLTRVYG